MFLSNFNSEQGVSLLTSMASFDYITFAVFTFSLWDIFMQLCTQNICVFIWSIVNGSMINKMIDMYTGNTELGQCSLYLTCICTTIRYLADFCDQYWYHYLVKSLSLQIRKQITFEGCSSVDIVIGTIQSVSSPWLPSAQNFCWVSVSTRSAPLCSEVT